MNAGNLKIIHIARGIRDPRIWTEVFCNALQEIGHLTIVDNGNDITDDEALNLIRENDIVLTGWNAREVPAGLADDKGRVQYICNITGELARFIPIEIIESGIPVTNWGDYPARSVAEGAMALLLATVKDLHHQIQTIRENGWRMDMHFHGGTLEDRAIGIYGLGVIGKALIKPFNARLMIFDPYVVDFPEDCQRAESLEELFDFAEIIVIHAGLTEETRNSVTADLLARLPRHGLIINTARGGIVDQEALFAELESGRLRAGLDVLEPDFLPEDHPARKWENLTLTAHRIDQGWPDFNETPKSLNRMQKICMGNLRRFIEGKPLEFRFDRKRYLLST